MYISADRATLILNNTIITDFISGDKITLAFPNPVTNRFNGDENSVVITKREDSNVCQLTLNVLKDSESDKILSDWAESSPPKILNGSLRTSFFRDDATRKSIYELTNGSFISRAGEVVNFTDGEKGATYVIEFRKAIVSKG